MMQEQAARLLRARLTDFFDRRTPWQRSLWEIGTPLGLREVVEYGEYVRSGAHNDRADLKYVCEGMAARVQLDSGIDDAVKADIDRLLKDKPEENRIALAITELSSRISVGYIDSWAASLSGTEPPGVELAARSIAAHLLDAGYSGEFLFRWLTDLSPDSPDEMVAALAAAETLMTATPQKFKVLVSCPAIPRNAAFLERSISGVEATAWQQAHCPAAPPVPASRALVLNVEALEPFAAAERAAGSIARLIARTAVVTDKQLRAHEKVWIAGQADVFDLNTGRRSVRVPMVQRHVMTLDSQETTSATQLDDALELVSSMAHGTDGAAITNGWAAIEGLLIEPGEKSRHLAADRMAAIIACSFVRAELTYLAWSHRDHGDDELAERLRAPEHSSNETLRLIEGALDAGETISCGSPSDEAALARIRQLRSDPQAVLRRVERYLTQALRRLYVQRNQVMHAGSFRSVTIPATLRTTPQLVGAGIDRVIAAYLLTNGRTSPLALAARAEVELRLAGSTASASLGRLLG